MTFCKIAPPTSGTGNATVRIISMKNKSTVPRSQSFTVVSDSGIRRTITVNQEGIKGKYLTLNFPSGTVSTSLSVGQRFFLSNKGPDSVYAEFYGELGTIKSVTSEQIIIDMSSLSQTDIDVIYDDLTVGDMIKANEIFFGIAVDDDPTVQWIPIVKTTETSGEAGNYNYTSDYVAETITQAYEGTVSGVLNCTATVKPLQLEWVTKPIPSKSFKKGNLAVSAIVSLKNVPNAQFGKPLSLIGEIYSINGEESGETYDITTWGFSFSSTIASVQTNADGGNTVTASINLNLDKPQSYETAVDTAYSEDEYGPYSSFIVSIGVRGMDGNYGYADWDIKVYQEALNRGTVSGEITLSPELGNMGIEDSCTFDVNYADIIPDTIHFVPGPEMENSDGSVYLDSWTPPSGSDPASGSFSFTIASNSEATTESYSFEVTGQDVEGNTYTASGSVDIA